MERLNQNKTTFFRPFNSVFERELHNMGKQGRHFNQNAAMNPIQTFLGNNSMPRKAYRQLKDATHNTSSLNLLHAKINVSNPTNVLEQSTDN